MSDAGQCARSVARAMHDSGRALLLIMLMGSLAATLPVHANSDDPFASLRWSARIVLVFAPADDDAQLQRQQRILAGLGPAGSERDIVVVYVVAARTSGARTALDPAALRQHYAVDAADFRVVLIGKDGGVKHRSDVPLDACTLLGLIDAMPMRQRERQDPDTDAADCIRAPSHRAT